MTNIINNLTYFTIELILQLLDIILVLIELCLAVILLPQYKLFVQADHLISELLDLLVLLHVFALIFSCKHGLNSYVSSVESFVGDKHIVPIHFISVFSSEP